MPSSMNHFLWKSRMRKHPYHIVDQRPWPFLVSSCSLFLVLGLISWIHKDGNFSTCLLLLVGCTLLWWRDVCRESTFQGKHTRNVIRGLRLGMLLFIVSEVSFFFSFFWSFFHSALNPLLSWPPQGRFCIDVCGVPLLNTVILLTSGATVTWAHQCLILGQPSLSLLYTLLLGFTFLVMQFAEYLHIAFTISDSVFGSIFFVLTGFHGLHVLIGTLFLLFVYVRLCLSHFSCDRHFGFEARAWYWHFVDVVWLFLYIWVYWWGF